MSMFSFLQRSETPRLSPTRAVHGTIHTGWDIEHRAPHEWRRTGSSRVHDGEYDGRSGADSRRWRKSAARRVLTPSNTREGEREPASSKDIAPLAK
jgi:hypothetical protein